MFDTCDVCRRQIISMTRKSRNLIEFKKFENRIQSIVYSIRFNLIIVRLHFLSILLRLYWRDFVLIWFWFIWYDVVNMFFRITKIWKSVCFNVFVMSTTIDIRNVKRKKIHNNSNEVRILIARNHWSRVIRTFFARNLFIRLDQAVNFARKSNLYRFKRFYLLMILDKMWMQSMRYDSNWRLMMKFLSSIIYIWFNNHKSEFREHFENEITFARVWQSWEKKDRIDSNIEIMKQRDFRVCKFHSRRFFDERKLFWFRIQSCIFFYQVKKIVKNVKKHWCVCIYTHYCLSITWELWFSSMMKSQFQFIVACSTRTMQNQLEFFFQEQIHRFSEHVDKWKKMIDVFVITKDSLFVICIIHRNRIVECFSWHMSMNSIVNITSNKHDIVARSRQFRMFSNTQRNSSNDQRSCVNDQKCCKQSIDNWNALNNKNKIQRFRNKSYRKRLSKIINFEIYFSINERMIQSERVDRLNRETIIITRNFVVRRKEIVEIDCLDFVEQNISRNSN